MVANGCGQLELEDGDVVDVHLEQTGGGEGAE